MHRFIGALPLVLLATPALAGATPWQDVVPSVRLRLIANDIRASDGSVLAGLELDMPQNFTTYWRLPGESGIPTEFDIAGSSGVATPSIQWPYPTPEVTNGFLDYVYHGATVLPVLLRLNGEAPSLKVAVTMGVCSNICVPVRASFSLPLSLQTPDVAEDIRLKQALALAPVAWQGASAPFASAGIDAKSGALTLTGLDPAIDPASVIASTADPTVIFDAPQKSPDNRSILLPLRGASVTTGWAATPIQLTFMTAMGSFEVSERVTASAAP
jgi:DsbC/DsbD-like thiol-disulfide interchange protein